MTKRRTNQQGFTIIELLIATMIFSIILIIIAGSIIQIGRLYYKSMASSRTQEVARTVLSDMSESIQFNSGAVVGTNVATLTNLGDVRSRGICVGNRLYSYRLGQQQTGTRHAMVVQNIASGCNGTRAQNLNSGGVTGSEMLSDKMRLTRMDVLPLAGDTYRVRVRVVYGDIDILCNPAAPAISRNSCTSVEQRTATENAILEQTTPNLSCKNIRSGTQFCSVSELSKIVKRRL